MVKESFVGRAAWICKALLVLSLMVATAIPLDAQSSPPPSEADAMPRRLARARALAAAHNLSAAAAELDAIRTSTADEAIRDVTRIMLMGIYLEQADYARVQALLEETYKARSADKESTIRAYFTLAGQSINGAREHLERYRAFGINVADKELPTEATTDLDRLRLLLERIADQAKEISGQDAKSTEAVALLEDAASVRLTLARDSEERQQWRRETASARQRLSASETSVASLRGGVPRPPATTTTSNIASNNKPATAANPTATNTTTPAASSTSKPPAQSSANDAPPPKQNETNATNPQSAGANGQPVSIGSLIDRATQKVSPKYPQAARTARVSGVVKVYVEVDETGVVAKVQRSDGPQLLRGAAESAARQWKFKPVLVDGQPVRVSGFISFSFTFTL